MIVREQYLKQLRPLFNTKIIKIITGIRRAGKSILLTQVIDELLKSGVKESQIIYLKLDLYENKIYRDKEALYNYINNKLTATAPSYLFLDEIQEVEKFEDVINSFLEKDVDIYLTGSNANLLSSEISTYLTGRYVTLEVYPFSFKEYLEYQKPENSDQAFVEYVKFGGLPQIQSFKNENEKRNLLIDLYNSILVKDIVERHKIRNVNQFENFIIYLLGITSKKFSAINVSNYFAKDKRSLSKENLYNYLSYTKEAFFIYGCQRYDIQGKKALETNEKIFINDQGFRQLFYNNERDIEKILENIIYFELRRRGYQIYVGYAGQYEIDFIATKDGNINYFQVSYLLASEETILREFRPLLLIKDQYPKYVLSLDKFDLSHDGVVHKNIIDFLLEND